MYATLLLRILSMEIPSDPGIRDAHTEDLPFFFELVKRNLERAGYECDVGGSDEKTIGNRTSANSCPAVGSWRSIYANHRWMKSDISPQGTPYVGTVLHLSTCLPLVRQLVPSP